MNITDSDITAAARDLRDEQNENLYVAPSPLKGRRTPTPVWWGAVAAALVVGFFVGKSLTPVPSSMERGVYTSEGATITMDKGNHSPLPGRGALEVSSVPLGRAGGEASLTGRAGGESAGSPSIIREVIHEVVHDTIYETRIVRVPVQQVMTAQADPTPSPAPSPGCSMLCDDIRYDLLAGN